MIGLAVDLSRLRVSVVIADVDKRSFGLILGEPEMRKTLTLSAVVLFALSSASFACSASKQHVQSMKPTTVADSGQSTVPSAPTQQTQ